MYIERKPLKDVPKDAIIISEQEVLSYYLNHVFGTSKTEGLLPLKYGSLAAGVGTLASNYVLVHYYMRRLKLRSFPLSCMVNLGLVAFPATLAASFHYKHCVSGILLQNLCTSCLYTRAAFLQNFFGILYGIVPSAIFLLLTAAVRMSFPVPGFATFENSKETYRIYLKFTKRIWPRILLASFAQTVLICAITREELKSFTILNKVLAEQNEKLRVIAAEYQQNNYSKTVQ